MPSVAASRILQPTAFRVRSREDDEETEDSPQPSPYGPPTPHEYSFSSTRAAAASQATTHYEQQLLQQQPHPNLFHFDDCSVLSFEHNDVNVPPSPCATTSSFASGDGQKKDFGGNYGNEHRVNNYENSVNHNVAAPKVTSSIGHYSSVKSSRALQQQQRQRPHVTPYGKDKQQQQFSMQQQRAPLSVVRVDTTGLPESEEQLLRTSSTAATTPSNGNASRSTSSSNNNSQQKGQARIEINNGYSHESKQQRGGAAISYSGVGRQLPTNNTRVTHNAPSSTRSIRFSENSDAGLSSYSNATRPQENVVHPSHDSSYDFPSALANVRKELEASKEAMFMHEQENKALLEECNNYQSQIKQMQAKLQQQSEMQKQSASEFQQEKKALLEKISILEKVKAQLNQVLQEKNVLQMRVDALTASANQTGQSLSDIRENESHLKTQLLSSQAEANASRIQVEKLQQINEKLQDDVKDWRAKLKAQQNETIQRVKDIREQLEAELGKVKQEKGKLELEMNRLQAMLKEAQLKAKKEGDGSATTIASLREELGRLNMALEKANSDVELYGSENKEMREKLDRYENRSMKHIACQTRGLKAGEPEDSTVLASDNSSDRVKQTRSTVGGAGFPQDFRNEISRTRTDLYKGMDSRDQHLVQIHESLLLKERVSMETFYNSKLSTLKQKMEAECTAKINDIERKCGAKINEIERKRKEEIVKMKNEFDAKALASAVLLEKAVADATSTKEELAAKHHQYQQLDMKVRELEESLRTEKERQKESHEEMVSLKKEWEEGTQLLLDDIRKECNAAISRGYSSGVRSILRGAVGSVSSKGVSPRTVLMEDEVSFVDHESAFYAPSISMGKQHYSNGLTTENFDQALKETEELVLGL